MLLTENLIAQGFEVFLPMCEVERSLRGKLILSSEPLFARYLFVRATQMANWAAVRSTRGVAIYCALEPVPNPL